MKSLINSFHMDGLNTIKFWQRSRIMFVNYYSLQLNYKLIMITIFTTFNTKSYNTYYEK